MKRLQYKKCNMDKCLLTPGEPTLKCNKTLDVILLLDGSGSLKEAGWKAEIKMAKTFIDAFAGSDANVEMAAILYSGPRTWGGVAKCVGKSAEPVDMEKDCLIVTVSHFTKDLATLKEEIA